MQYPVSSLKSREIAHGVNDSPPIDLKQRANALSPGADKTGRDAHQDCAGWRWSTPPLGASTELAKREMEVTGQQEHKADISGVGEDEPPSETPTSLDIMFRNLWWNLLVDQPMKDRVQQEDDDL